MNIIPLPPVILADTKLNLIIKEQHFLSSQTCGISGKPNSGATEVGQSTPRTKLN